MLKYLLYSAGIILLVLGGDSLYQALSSRQQASLTCDQFVQQRPRDNWLKVTGCEVDYVGAGVRESRGRIQELLFPVRPEGHSRSEPAALVASTRDPSVLAIAQRTMGDGRQPDQEHFLVMMLEIVTALRASREVDGFARTGLFEQLRTRRLLSGLSAPVAPDVVLIDLHARPDMLTPAIVSAAGAIALAAAIGLTLRGRRRKTAAVPAIARETLEPALAAHATGPAEPRAGAPRLRALLLNLGPSEGLGAIERAPAIDDAASVRATIIRQFPGAHFGPDNRAVLSGREDSLTIDLGGGDIVHAIVVDARGAAAILAVRQLLATTGWRAYAPKSGTFLDTNQLSELAASS